LLGFAHPQDLFGSDVLPDTFRRLWYYVASICFRSTEAFAAYIKEDSAMEKLASLPLLPLSKKQRGMIGEARARESFRAQLSARGIVEAPKISSESHQSIHFTSEIHGNGSLSAQSWASHVRAGLFKRHFPLPRAKKSEQYPYEIPGL